MKYRLPTLNTRYRNASMYRPLSVGLLLISTYSLQANEPSSSLVQRRLKIGDKEVSVALSENGRDLVVTVPNSKPLDVSFQRKRVTSFQVGEWFNGAGAVIVAEVREGKNEYSYYWATLWIEKGEIWKELPRKDGREFGIKATYPILNNVEKFAIGKLQGSGDGFTVSLIDPTEIPDSRRRLVMTYVHNCAIGTIGGHLLREFVTPEELKRRQDP